MNKVVRFLIFFICSVIILLIVVTLLLPPAGRVVKKKDINARKDVVLDELTNIRNYSMWYPWLAMDPGVDVNYQQNGKKFSWNSNIQKKEKCTYEVTQVEGDSILHFKFTDGNAPPITGAYVLRPSADSNTTTIIWYMNMESGWTPWWRFYGAMMDKLNGPLLETGLTNLKVICEKQMLLPASR